MQYYVVAALAAVGSLSAILLATSSYGHIAAINSTNQDVYVEYSYRDPNRPYWNEDWTKTGNASILALEIAPQENNFKEVKYGRLPWLDPAIDNLGNATLVEDVKVKEFMRYTADGNTDFKVELPDGSVKFYRLYFMEVP